MTGIVRRLLQLRQRLRQAEAALSRANVLHQATVQQQIDAIEAEIESMCTEARREVDRTQAV